MLPNHEDQTDSRSKPRVPRTGRAPEPTTKREPRRNRLKSTRSVPRAERRDVKDQAKSELALWSRNVDRLIRAFRASEASIPGLAAKLEELRNRRDTVEIKAQALARHSGERFEEAQHDFKVARAEMLAVWRSVLAAVERDGAFAGLPAFEVDTRERGNEQ